MAQPLDAKIDSLEEFREVNILNPAVGDVLQYNGWEWRNAAASAGSGPTTKRVATNLSYAASTTISDFTFAAAANTTYLVQGMLLLNQSAMTGVDIDVDGPSGFEADGVLTAGAGGAQEFSTFTEAGSGLSMSNGIENSIGDVPCVLNALIRTSSTAGNVSFDIGTSSGTGTNTVVAGSCITITEIA